MDSGDELAREVPLANRFRSGTTSSAAPLASPGTSATTASSPPRASSTSPRSRSRPTFLGGRLPLHPLHRLLALVLPAALLGRRLQDQRATSASSRSWTTPSPLPISELYYLGGINTVRGYLLRTISPTIIAGDVEPRRTPPCAASRSAATSRSIFNFELEFPIFEKVGIRGVLFYDAGNAFAAERALLRRTARNRPAAGPLPLGGLRLPLVLAHRPAALRVGHPAQPQAPRTTSRSLFEFTIGNFFW